MRLLVWLLLLMLLWLLLSTSFDGNQSIFIIHRHFRLNSITSDLEFVASIKLHIRYTFQWRLSIFHSIHCLPLISAHNIQQIQQRNTLKTTSEKEKNSGYKLYLILCWLVRVSVSSYLYVFTWTELNMTSMKHFSVWTIKFIFIQLPGRQRDWIWYLLWISCCYNPHKMPVFRHNKRVLNVWSDFYFGILCIKQAPWKILLLRFFFSPQIVGCTGNGRVILIIVDITRCMYQNQTSRLVIL